MREIKLRFWDKRKKYMFTSENTNSCEVWDCVLDKDRFITQQYTGLKDKAEIEIFSGDIVKHDYEDEPQVFEWADKFAAYRLMPSGIFPLGIDKEKMEVIGNQFEHHHLLPKE